MAEMKYPYELDDPMASLAEAERRIHHALKTGAKELDLSACKLNDLPVGVLQLTELEGLYLEWNQIEAIPESLSKLTRLRTLRLHNNRLTRLPESIGELTQLERLELHSNRLKALPDSIGRLIHIRVLFLDRNQLTVVPESLGQITLLRGLHLYGNELRALPESLRELSALEELYLHDNTHLGLPPEVLGPTYGAVISTQAKPAKPADILDYYFRTRDGARPLNEAKLILLGRGEVGKTCLVNRLVHDKFASTSMTRGIAITQWPVTSGNDTVRLHVWDFGGQEIQHATHQFFLTERSLYLVVLNGRAGDEENDAEYWLKFVKTFGASSPTIVVLNKFQMQPFQVNRRALQEKYPFIRAFVETDCESNTKNGRAELIKEIESAIGDMEHVRAAFPADWFRIKERLAEMKEPFISFDEYRKICAELGEKDATAQERLAGFLDDLGIALNFREDQQLREETVLNPHWITEGFINHPLT